VVLVPAAEPALFVAPKRFSSWLRANCMLLRL
jgi:hypothetical protein